MKDNFLYNLIVGIMIFISSVLLFVIYTNTADNKKESKQESLSNLQVNVETLFNQYDIVEKYYSYPSLFECYLFYKIKVSKNDSNELSYKFKSNQSLSICPSLGILPTWWKPTIAAESFAFEYKIDGYDLDCYIFVDKFKSYDYYYVLVDF